MAQFRTSRVFDVTFVLALAGLLLAGYLHKTAVNDWLFFRTYQPSAVATQTAKDAGMSVYGTRLFYRTDPQFVDLATVNSKCSVENLGCIDQKGRVYILNDLKQHDQSVVTAAHEMLHLAYRRLSEAEKDRIGPLLDRAIQSNATAISDELRDQNTVADRRDEAYSLLGSEYFVMPSTLEACYRQYFTDRTLVVAASNRSRP